MEIRETEIAGRTVFHCGNPSGIQMSGESGAVSLQRILPSEESHKHFDPERNSLQMTPKARIRKGNSERRRRREIFKIEGPTVER
jgi:hypothetical protein